MHKNLHQVEWRLHWLVERGPPANYARKIKSGSSAATAENMCGAEVKSRTQGSRPRTQKKSETKAKDSLSEDRHSRRPRTGMLEAKDTSASALQKKKKVFTKIFQAISTKKNFFLNFSSAPQNFNNLKKWCCSGAEVGPIFEDLRPRGQGLDLRGQGQGLQNVSSKTPPLVWGSCAKLVRKACAPSQN